MKTIIDAINGGSVKVENTVPDNLPPEARAALTLGMMRTGIRPVRFVPAPPEQKKDEK